MNSSLRFLGWLGWGAAAVLLVNAPVAARANNISVLTGGTAGVYYPLGVALAKIYGNSIPGTKTIAQVTKASVENLSMLNDGKGELAFVLGDSLVQAWTGDLDAGFRGKLDKLRMVGAIYPNYMHIVASKTSGIRSIYDLKGKRVSVGAPRSGTEINVRVILSAAGIRYEDLGKAEYLPFNESVELIKKGQLDATLQSAGLGVASITELANAMDISVVEIPPAIVKKAGSPFVEGTIPAGTYRGQSGPVKSAVVQNYLVTRADLPEPLVYQMTKALFENVPTLIAAHSSASAIRVENAPKSSPIPLHPGAARYYREKGIAF